MKKKHRESDSQKAVETRAQDHGKHSKTKRGEEKPEPAAETAVVDANGHGKRSHKKKGKKHAKSAVGATALGNGNLAGGSAAEHDPKRGKLSRKEYEKELRRLQTELCKLQDWVTQSGQRVVVVFEGRDAAGKGGLIRALTARVSPRVFRVVALPAPSSREKSQIYLQRYLQHFPAAGEVVIFDRSWYNRAGVEHVMGFVKKDAYRRFLELCPEFERVIVDNGVILLKYWLEVGDEEQKRRFEARIKDPMRQWKLSAMDLPSRERWYEYSRARDMMLEATDTEIAPWHIVRSDSKRHAHVNFLSHFLGVIPYKRVKRPKVTLPKRSTKNAYDDEKPMRGRRWIPEVAVGR